MTVTRLVLATVGFCLLALFDVCIAQTATQCLAVNEMSVYCLNESLPSSAITLTCPSFYQLNAVNAVIYSDRYNKLTGCPAGPTSSSCQQAVMTSQLLRSCAGVAGSSCVFEVPYPSQKPCTSSAFQNQFYVQITYNCQPESSPYSNRSAQTSSLCTTSSILSSALININSDGLQSGTFIYNTQCYASIFIPAGIQVFVSAKVFFKQPLSSSCSQMVLLTESNRTNSAYQLCSASDQFTIGCSNQNRYFKLQYISSNYQVGSLFVVQLQAGYLSSISVQTGFPPFPLPLGSLSSPTTTAEVITSGSTTTTISSSATTTFTTSATATVNPIRDVNVESVSHLESDTTYIAVGVVLCVAVLVIISTTVAWSLRKRKLERRERMVSNGIANRSYGGTDTGNAKEFIRFGEIYVDGDHKSQLGLDRQMSGSNPLSTDFSVA